MNYIEVPNLPQRPVRLVLVDGRINEEIESSLKTLGIEVLKTKAYPGMYEAVSFHPDIMFHHLGGKRIVFAPGVNPGLLNAIASHGFELIEGATVLSPDYPGNIAYNAARVGNHVIHNLKYTDSVLKDELEKMGVEFIHVNQGYAKCSVAVADENSIITSDKGIAKAADKKGIEVLLIEPDESILLPGLKNGFIGGCTGLLNKSMLAVTGNVYKLRSGDEIRKFLEIKKIGINSLSKGNAIDTGSVLPLATD